MTVTRYLRPAEDPAGRAAPSTAFSFSQPVPSPASLADVLAYPPLARTFVTTSQAQFSFSANAIAVPGKALDAILSSLTPVRGKTLEVTASSTYGSLPSLAPANLFRPGNPGAWIAGNQQATLSLSWPGMRTVRRMVIQPLPGLASAPESIKITSSHGVRFASVGLGGITTIVPPLRTNQMTISFPVVQYATAAQPISGQPVRLPVGLSSLSIPALNGLRPAAPAPGASFALPCGSGPSLRVDGRTLRTRVSGKAGSLIAFEPVHVRLCGVTSALSLGAGQHKIMAASPGAFTLTGLSLVSAGPSGLPGAADAQDLQPAAAHGPGPASAGRSVKVLAWGQEHRTVRVGAGTASYLELHQNANAGWTATLNGRTLRPVRLDGWQQGFVVPAGNGGVVTLTFKPVKFYHVWIILSVVGALLLLMTALGGRRRETVREQLGSVREQMDGPSPGARVPTDVPAARVSTDVPAARVPTDVQQQRARWLALLALTVGMAIVGGPVALVVPVVAVLARRWPSWFVGLAAAGMLVAGVLTAAAAHPALLGTGAFGAAAQVCALVALTCALMPDLPDWAMPRWLSRRAGGQVRRAGTRAGGRAGGPPMIERFALADELTCYYDSASEPANVHLEAWVTGRLDPAAVRAAVSRRAGIAAQDHGQASAGQVAAGLLLGIPSDAGRGSGPAPPSTPARKIWTGSGTPSCPSRRRSTGRRRCGSCSRRVLAATASYSTRTTRRSTACPACA